jgi:trehalose 6-phosphate phosphatase
MATAVERSWQEPDHGIWEVRMDKRHHVHSKVMCWVALDRAIRLADQFVGVRREGWLTLRERIREDVLGNGFDATRGGFVAAYGHGVADASALTVGLSGLVEPRDPRFVGTVELVQRELLDGGTVYRYTFDDEIPGPEGGFHLCTGWLVEALALIGRMDEARGLFESLCAAAGETGIMSEQWCPMERTGLGNLPQAYSHAAIINAAVTLQMLEDRG